jgi:ankyrin repeat protein
MRRLWPGIEFAMAALALVALVGWQTGGGSALDRLIGRASVDERLIAAAAGNDQAAFDAALAAGASTTARDPAGMSALSYSAMMGNASCASRLLAAGATVDSVDDWGFTPLMHAARFDHVDVAAMLLRHGADPSHRNTWGETAVHAARNGGAERVASLLAAWNDDAHG